MFGLAKKSIEKKPLIFPRFNIGYSKNSHFALCIYLTKEDYRKIPSLDISEAHITENDILLVIKDHYVVFHDIRQNILKQALDKKLVYYFFDDEGTYLQGIKLA